MRFFPEACQTYAPASRRVLCRGRLDGIRIRVLALVFVESRNCLIDHAMNPPPTALMCRTSVGAAHSSATIAEDEGALAFMLQSAQWESLTADDAASTSEVGVRRRSRNETLLNPRWNRNRRRKRLRDRS